MSRGHRYQPGNLTASTVEDTGSHSLSTIFKVSELNEVSV